MDRAWVLPDVWRLICDSFATNYSNRSSHPSHKCPFFHEGCENVLSHSWSISLLNLQNHLSTPSLGQPDCLAFSQFICVCSSFSVMNFSREVLYPTSLFSGLIHPALSLGHTFMCRETILYRPLGRWATDTSGNHHRSWKLPKPMTLEEQLSFWNLSGV